MKREYESFPMHKEFRYEILKNNKGKYIKILDFNNSTSSPVIPSYIENLPVKVIGKDAFEHSNIKTITLPNTLTTIESYAFFNCKNLKKYLFLTRFEMLEIRYADYANNLKRQNGPNWHTLYLLMHFMAVFH